MKVINNTYIATFLTATSRETKYPYQDWRKIKYFSRTGLLLIIKMNGTNYYLQWHPLENTKDTVDYSKGILSSTGQYTITSDNLLCFVSKNSEYLFKLTEKKPEKYIALKPIPKIW